MIMTARTHDWVNRGRWVVEVESRVMSSDAHLYVAITLKKSQLRVVLCCTSSLDVRSTT